MQTTTEPTEEQLQAAFERLHKQDWPVHSLAELQRVALLQRLVDGTARRLANGGQLVDASHDLTGPITSRPTPAAKTVGRFPGAYPIPARRHGDQGPDLKRRAAGEKDDE